MSTQEELKGRDNKDIMSASDLFRITSLTRQNLNLHHENELLMAYSGARPEPSERCLERAERPERQLQVPTKKSVTTRIKGPHEVTDYKFITVNGFNNNKKNNKNPKLEHYQTLSNTLANWIFSLSKEKIIAATIKGHGWTNIYQYLPTNHPEGIPQIMPILSAAKAQVWQLLSKGEQEHLLKYFAGVDGTGMPIKSTKENDGVPLILLIQGPKIGSNRSLDCLRAQGLKTVMDQLREKYNEVYPGVTIVHRWVGKNGYIVEAVWDHDGYQNRMDMQTLLRG